MAVNALLVRSEVSVVSAQPHTPLPAEVDERLTPSARKDLFRDEGGRVVVLALRARMGPLWDLVPPASINWVGASGAMTFSPRNSEAVKAALVQAGYTSAYFAKRSKDAWGLREPTLPTAGLHFRGESGGIVNVHVDLHPPSGTGLWHWIQDSVRRGTTHTPASVRRAVESVGVTIPVLSQQRIHGELTARLARVERSVQGGGENRASLELACAALDGAAAILWTRDVISSEQLHEAAALLLEADLELDVAGRKARDAAAGAW
jgi:hypothetical protein